MPVTPEVLAMMVCDQVIIDAKTGKQSLIGAFNMIGGTRFPLRYPGFTVYVALTEGYGDTTLRLRLIEASETGEPLFERPLTIRFTDPRMICEMHTVIYNVTFPEPAEYRLQLFCDQELLMQRRLLVRQVKRVDRRQPPDTGDAPDTEPPPETD